MLTVPVDATAMLEELGLSKSESRVYLCLLEQSPLAATTIADLTGTSRSSVYLVLRSLVEKGLIDAGAGYNSRYHAAPPQGALTGLLERQRAALEIREQQVEQLVPELAEMFTDNGIPDGEIVEILRTPKLIGERFERLQAETERSIDVVVRGPLQIGGSNEAELAALRRGVRVRAIYDSAVLTEEPVAGNLDTWTSGGERARVRSGDLPMKFALFDSRVVLMPLVAPRVAGVVAIIIRNHELAAALEFLFDTLWQGSEPIEAWLAGRVGRP